MKLAGTIGNMAIYLLFTLIMMKAGLSISDWQSWVLLVLLGASQEYAVWDFQMTLKEGAHGS